MVPHPDQTARVLEVKAPRPHIPNVFEIHPMVSHPRELTGSGRVVRLALQLVYQIQSHTRHRHLELLPRGRRVDAALCQLGDEVGIRLIGKVAGALAIVEPALTYERARGPHYLEAHGCSGSAHVCRGEPHQFAQRHVPAPVTRGPMIATLAVADGELDGARMLPRVDQPLPAGGDGVLSRERGSCKDAGDE